MAFIRKKSTFKTGYQESSRFNDLIDLNQDFVMVYGIANDLETRIKEFRAKGYEVHLMTGMAWGDYDDYYDGSYDGILNHYEEEGQVDRLGKHMDHGKVPYMVPVLSFLDYLVEKLKKAIDLGIYHFHLEEPEFWSFTGYSKAFRREYEIYYQEKYEEPHSSLDKMFKANKLKALLYSRALDYLSIHLKDYGYRKYHQPIYFYVPTHSLLNYSQWKIISPESNLLNLNYIDGFIAQVWTGTSREPNVFKGVKKERTFETAFLEYGSMHELVRKTNKKIWFLNDPIEDNPTYTWENYRFNYLKTLVAGLFHSEVDKFEICPWPNRIFNRKLPMRHDDYHNEFSNVEPSYISYEYDTFLNNIFNTLGDIESCKPIYQGNNLKVGLFLSDTAMMQRDFPDHVLNNKLKYRASLTFPDFYGLSLPLLKEGIPLKPVILEKITKNPHYLDDFEVLIISYEFIKPLNPDYNYSLYRFVRNGGILLVVDSNEDPYNEIDSWWKVNNYDSPTTHLLDLFNYQKGPQKVKKGIINFLKVSPSKITDDINLYYEYLNFFQTTIALKGITYQKQNFFLMERNNYVVASVMDESSDEKLRIKGTYANLFDIRFKIVSDVELSPKEEILLYNVDKAKDFDIIGTTLRPISSISNDSTHEYKLRGKVNLNVYFRFKSSKKPTSVCLNGQNIVFEYDFLSKTVLINFLNFQKEITLIIYYHERGNLGGI